MYLHTNHTHSAVSLSLTYTGSGYAHYSLTEEGARQRRQAGGVLRSTYRDVVSLSLRTTHTDGSLFHMQDSSGSEYLYIQVCVYYTYKCIVSYTISCSSVHVYAHTGRASDKKFGVCGFTSHQFRQLRVFSLDVCICSALFLSISSTMYTYMKVESKAIHQKE